MKKNIFIVLLALITMVSVLYAYAQKVRADAQEIIANEMRMLAQEQKRVAEAQAAEAARQRQLVEQHLLKATR
jgi:hypothetical protein